LNIHERIADTTIANIWIVKDGIIKTPALTEGCVSGTLRKHLLNCCHKDGLPVAETSITVEDALQASELFLTNAIQGVKWVKQLHTSHYQYNISKRLYENYLL